jgi:hypothetical protein
MRPELTLIQATLATTAITTCTTRHNRAMVARLVARAHERPQLPLPLPPMLQHGDAVDSMPVRGGARGWRH